MSLTGKMKSLEPEPAPAPGTPRKSWFEKNPKKTLFFSLLVILLALTFVTEKILAYKSGVHRSGIKRFIRLREYEPLYSAYISPSEDEIKKSDSLIAQKYLFRTDRDGFIVPSKIHENPDLTLIFFGGSTTACHYVEEDQRFPYLVGRLIEERRKLKVNSYNSGVGGNNSLHSINILLNKVMSLKPDIVIMMHNINDMTILLYEKTYWDTNPSRSPLIEIRPYTFSSKEIINLVIPNLYDELKNMEKRIRRTFYPKTKIKSQVDEFAHVRGKRIAIDTPYLLKEFKMNLQLFINVCEARTITPVLMTQANRLKNNPDPKILEQIKGLETQQGISYQEYKRIYDLFNQAIKEVGILNNILVIDLAAEIPQEKEYMYDVVHFTNNGSISAANIIQERLQPMVNSLRRRSNRTISRVPTH